MKSLSPSIAEWGLAGLVLLLLVAGIQAGAGAFAAGFGAYPDEASHFVGGLMVRSYLLHAGASPMAFARDYYLHQPFFAIGYWPPLFYVLEGVWMLVLGYSRISLMILSGAFAWLSAIFLFGYLRREFSLLWALPTASLFLLVSSVRWSSCVVMTDLPLALFCFLATLAIGRFFETISRRWSVLAGILAAAAMLTKYLAVFMILSPALLFLLDRRWPLLRRREIWLMPLVFLALCGPWLFWARKFLAIGVDGAPRQPLLDRFATLLRLLAADFGLFAGPLVLFALLWTFFHWKQITPTLRLLALQPLCGAAFVLAAPAGVEARYFIPFYAAALATVPFFLRAVLPASKPWAPALLLAVVLWLGFAHPYSFDPLPDGQMRAIAREVGAFAPAGSPLAVLVPTQLEGPMIAELAAAIPARPQFVIVRPTKLLSRVNWLSTHYEMLTPDLLSLRTFIDSLPLDVILLADGAYSRQPHDLLLREMVTAPGSLWTLRRSYPTAFGRGVHLYTRNTKSTVPLATLLAIIRDRMANVQATN